jgi:hypothetical protein
LRVDRDYRGRWLVPRGFRVLRELDRHASPRGYVTTIIEGNREAEGVLVLRARGVMPRYRKIDRLITLALPTANKRRGNDSCGRTLAEIVAFLDREGRKRNFFPAYDEQAFRDETTRGFDPKDFVIVERDGAIAGVAGLWDQSAYKQSVVDGYDAVTSVARPLFNVAAPLLRRAPLPRPGNALRFAYGSFFCAIDASVARELIERLLGVAHARRVDHLLLGFAKSDPLLRAAQAFRHVAYSAGIYTVAWSDAPHHDFHEQLDDRPRSLEIAAL